MVRTCITGASGRLGRVLVETFRERGDEIVNAHEEVGDLNYLVFAHRYRGEPSFVQEMRVNLHWIREWIERQTWLSGDHSVVLIGSAASRSPAKDQSHAYNLSKACLPQLARIFSNRMRINVLSPDTFTGPQAVITPQQVAEVARFLCSPVSSGLNGQELMVTG